MSNGKQYALWIRPFGDIAFSLRQHIKKLAEEYDTPLFEPHVTLISGLCGNEPELIQWTNILAETLHPFDILLTRAGFDKQYYRCLYVYADNSEELQHARKTAERLFDVDPDEPFKPHLSLMYGDLDRKEKERILNRMGRQFHIRFGATNLLLISTSGDPADWQEVHSANFVQ